MTQYTLKKTIRSLAIVTLAVAVLATTAIPAQACEFLDNLCPWNWGRSNECVATTYAPPFTPVAAPAVACCPTVSSYAVARTACYVPQTCYQTAYRTIPMTSYQAFNTCDPCTGCPVTTLRPVVTYRRAAQLVPYTTYRMVWQNTPSYTSCYGGCATGCATGCDTGCYSGCSTCTSGCDSGACGSGVVSSGCSSCAPTTTTTITPQAEPQPTFSTPSTNGSGAPNGSGNGGVWSEPANVQRPIETQIIKPSPEPDSSTSQGYQSKPFTVPQLVPAGRSASNVVRHVSYETVAPASTLVPMNTVSPTNSVVNDTNEWEAVR